MIEERLKAVIAYSGLNDSAFARKIGVQQMTLWRQINGARKISLETIMAVADAFPEIDANWLLRGNGLREKGVRFYLFLEKFVVYLQYICSFVRMN